MLKTSGTDPCGGAHEVSCVMAVAGEPASVGAGVAAVGAAVGVVGSALAAVGARVAAPLPAPQPAMSRIMPTATTNRLLAVGAGRVCTWMPPSACDAGLCPLATPMAVEGPDAGRGHVVGRVPADAAMGPRYPYVDFSRPPSSPAPRSPSRRPR